MSPPIIFDNKGLATPEPDLVDGKALIDLKKQTEYPKLEEKIFSSPHLKNEELFLFAIIHHHPAETLHLLLEKISFVEERYFKIAVAHYAPESILISMINLIRKPSESTLIVAINNQAPTEVISQLLQAVPLTRETLRAAIVYGLPITFLTYLLACIKPTPSDFLIAFVHRAPIPILYAMLRLKEIFIAALSIEECEELLDDFIKAEEDLLPIEVLNTALKYQKGHPLLTSILKRTMITEEVFLLALTYKISDDLQLQIIEALEIDGSILSSAENHDASSQVIEYISKKMA